MKLRPTRAVLPRANRLHRKRWLRLAPAITAVALTADVAPSAAPQPRPEEKALALSALEFGGSVGKLLWVSSVGRSAPSSTDGDRYKNLAIAVRDEIEMGRAS